ncbi:rRNA processing/ribosome biogenesis-domain-containing protein [Schizophyllum commune]
MDAHVLKTLLQIHLASDASATLHVPYILATLKPEHLAPSSHLPKWTNRIHSLLHSKEPGGRWAGLSLAIASARLSRSFIIDCAQDWLTVTFALLSRNETLPVIKAAIRLTYTIFSAATDVPEFQRQISTPNVPKFATAIIPLVEKYTDVELKTLCLQTLSQLIPLYPTLLRPSSATLNKLALNLLSGQYPSPTPPKILEAASRLYCCLHLTGGKVGAATAWRKTLDDTLAFGWSAFRGLRSTFTPGAAQPADPAAAIALDKDRLHCAVYILCDLLSAHTPRAVQVPLGSLNAFVVALLNAGDADASVPVLDVNARTMQLSAVTFIIGQGCELLQKLVLSLPHHVSPHLSHWLTSLAYLLEVPHPVGLRAQVLRTIACILERHPSFHAPLIINRLARASIPQLTILLSRDALTDSSSHPATTPSTTTKKGKKRARGFEGDESLRLTRIVACPTPDDAAALLSALDVVRYLLRAAELAPMLRSIASRVLLSVHLALPGMAPGAVAGDFAVYGRLVEKVQKVVVEVSAGSSSAMGKGLPLAMKGALAGVNEDAFRTLDLLLHPRLPPLVRPLPHVDALTLFAGEESAEEKRTRIDMGFSMSADAPTAVSNEANEASAMEQDQPVDTAPAAAPHASATFMQPPALKTYPSAPPIATMPPPTSAQAEPAYVPASSTAAALAPAALPLAPAPPKAPMGVITGTSTSRAEAQTEVVSMAVDEDDDEEMPEIDMSSDSEGE